MRRHVIVSALLLAAVTPAAAQDVILRLEARDQRMLRDAPPSGFLQLEGAVVGTVAPGREYGVLSLQRRQSGIGGQETWLEVVPLDPTGEPVPGPSGWTAYDDEAFQVRNGGSGRHLDLLGE